MFGIKIAEWIERMDNEGVLEAVYNDPNSTYAGNGKGEVLIYTPEQERKDREKEILNKMEGDDKKI